ncbi:MAG: hypothetical protein GY854_31060, partial [Deltaproteobacteria bacterium]|nr:hypothetical protein [Deltaproteobacteria bacterium]
MSHKVPLQSRLYTALACLFITLTCYPMSAPAQDESEEESPDAGALPDVDTLSPEDEPARIETLKPTEEGEEDPQAVRWVEEPTEPVLADSQMLEDDKDQSPRGPRYALEKVDIHGNKKTVRKVILHYIEIKPGEVFSADDIRLEKARYRLLASGLFHSVELSLKRGSKRGFAVLIVNVKERNTIVVQDIVFGFSEITPYYGSLDVAERSFLGTGVNVSAAVVISRDQYGYRLRFGDDHFLNTDFGLHAEGLYSHTRDFFGTRGVCVDDCNDTTGTANSNFDDYAVMKYNRAGLRFGTGYNLLGDNFISIDYRFEVLDADV